MEKLNSTVPGIDLLFSYRKNEKVIAQILLGYAKEILEYYNKTLGFYPYKKLIITSGFKNSFGGYPDRKDKIYLHGINMFESKPIEYWKWILSHEIAHIYFGFCIKSEEAIYEVCGLNWLMIGLGIYLDYMYILDNKIEWDFHKNILLEYKQVVEKKLVTSLLISNNTVVNKQLTYYNSIVFHGKSFAIIKYIEKIKSVEFIREKIIELFVEYKFKILTVKNLFQFFELNKDEVKIIRSFLSNSETNNLHLIDTIAI